MLTNSRKLDSYSDLFDLLYYLVGIFLIIAILPISVFVISICYMSVEEFLSCLENGDETIINRSSGAWQVNQSNFAKINDIFKQDKKIYSMGQFTYWVDKVDLYSPRDNYVAEKNIRMVPGCWIRRGVYLGTNVVVMPNVFINVGVHIGNYSMIDSGVTVGSCAYVGEKCHISSNVVLAGVLEPSSSMPVIIEDHVFIGAQCVIAEGVIIPEGCVIGAGTKITSSTKIVDTNNNVVEKILPYSVIVPGSYQRDNVFLDCAVVIKQVDEKTRAKTSINMLLR